MAATAARQDSGGWPAARCGASVLPLSAAATASASPEAPQLAVVGGFAAQAALLDDGSGDGMAAVFAMPDGVTMRTPVLNGVTTSWHNVVQWQEAWLLATR